MVASDTEYLTVAEAATLLRVSTSTVWRWIRADQLRADRIGARSVRIPRSSLDQVSAPLRTPEERKRYAAHVVGRLKEISDKLLADRGGKLFDSSVDAINEAREARYEDL